MQQEMSMDTQPGSGRAFPSDAVSSSNTTNFGAQHRPRSPRSPAQHRQNPCIIPGKKSPTQTLCTVHENSSFGTDTGVDSPLTADQRRSTGTLESSLLTTSNVAPSTQLITSTFIPDLTSLITRCSPDPISGGTYGNIYKCVYHGPEGDAEVAVKAIRPQYFNAEMFRRELGIWKRLWHSNILKFMGTSSDFGPSVALVAPWMTNGTLTSFLDQNNKTLGLRDRLLLLRDIAAGLNYLHTFSLTEDGHTGLNPVVHGDLTGTNVLIDSDRKAYLADFGLSGTMKKFTGMTYLVKMSCHPGAVRWAAPELLFGEESDSAATTRSDMYSFGSIMLQVLTGNVPWCHIARDYHIPSVVIGGKIHPRPHGVYVTDRHWNFMTRCWSMSYTDRPPAEEAVRFVDSALYPSMSPQTLTLSISSDEQHPGIARNDYLGGDTDARFPVMQDIDSALDARENYPGVMLPAYPSATYTTSLEPLWTQSILPRPHTSNFSAMYQAYFPDEDDNNVVIPSGYCLGPPINYNNTTHYNLVTLNMQQNASLQHYVQHILLFASPVNRYNTVHHNLVSLNMQQNASLQHYMQHVLRIQYLHADGSIDKLMETHTFQ